MNIDEIKDPKLRARIREQDLRQNKSRLVRRLEAGEPKPAAVQALVDRPKKLARGKGRVAVIVTLITCRTREVDDDNNVGSLKPLRDAVADYIGIDDGDARFRFRYGQVCGMGDEGVIVMVETV